MSIRGITVLMAFGLIVLGCRGHAQINQEEQDKVVTTATQWLQLVDGQEYVKSWEEAAHSFKEKLTREAWVNTMSALQPKVGNNAKREFKEAVFKDKLPGVPQGKYLIIQFISEFEKKGPSVETVTMTQEKDLSWRCVGYFIR
jgi:hypothetical protein